MNATRQADERSDKRIILTVTMHLCKLIQNSSKDGLNYIYIVVYFCMPTCILYAYICVLQSFLLKNFTTTTITTTTTTTTSSMELTSISSSDYN